jgi:ABC-2 type transport system permease protein
MAKTTVRPPVQGAPASEQQTVAVSSGGAANQQTLRNIRLVAGREYANRVKARSFIVTTIILLVIVFLATFVPTLVQYISSRTAASTPVIVVNEAGPIAGLSDTALALYIGAGLNGTASSSRPDFAVSSRSPNELDGLQSRVKQGNLDILLVLTRAADQSVRFTYASDASSLSDTNLPKFQALAQQLSALDAAQRLGLTPAQTSSLFAPANVTVVYAQGTTPVGQIVASYVLAFAGAILIYMAVQVYGSVVAAGVAEEKSSRIMEILVNAATPFQLLAGKVLGIGAASLTQMGSLVVVGIGALLLQTPIQSALLGANAGGGGFMQYLTAYLSRSTCCYCCTSCWRSSCTPHCSRDWARWSDGRRRCRARRWCLRSLSSVDGCWSMPWSTRPTRAWRTCCRISRSGPLPS